MVLVGIIQLNGFMIWNTVGVQDFGMVGVMVMLIGLKLWKNVRAFVLNHKEEVKTLKPSNFFLKFTLLNFFRKMSSSES